VSSDESPPSLAESPDEMQDFFGNLRRDGYCPDCGDRIARSDRHVEIRLGITTTVCNDCCTCE